MIRRLNIRNIVVNNCKKYSDISIIIENAIANAMIKNNIPKENIINIIEKNWNDDWIEITIYFKDQP